ncbi:MAG: Response regulatory protein [Bacteroidetes bacterium]|nr:Response regulatory protein [Bacteroidota bacterium]
MTYKKPLSVGQVAEICRVSKKTVLNWIYDGGLKAFTTYGGHYRVWPANVKKFLITTGMDIPFDFVDDRTTHILIIDDDYDFSTILKSAIVAELPDVDVTVTDDGYEGLMLIGELKPQLVILDIKMPKLDGFQVLELLKTRKAEQEVKVLVITGYLDPETRQQLSKTIADHWMDKLTDINTMIKTIAAYVRSEKPMVQNENNP